MRLHGDGTWPFVAEVKEITIGAFDGHPLVATWFGGTDDPQDSGNTASGFNTKKHPEVMACSLPMEFGAMSRATAGAPIPRLPWGLDSKGNEIKAGAHVEVMRINGTSIIVPLIDLGPAKSASHLTSERGPKYNQRMRLAKSNSIHIIDLTKPAFFKLGGEIAKGILPIVGIRIFSLE